MAAFGCRTVQRAMCPRWGRCGSRLAIDRWSDRREPDRKRIVANVQNSDSRGFARQFPDPRIWNHGVAEQQRCCILSDARIIRSRATRAGARLFFAIARSPRDLAIVFVDRRFPSSNTGCRARAPSADQRLGEKIAGQPDAEGDENDRANSGEHFRRGRVRSGRIIVSFDHGSEISGSVGAQSLAWKIVHRNRSSSSSGRKIIPRGPKRARASKRKPGQTSHFVALRSQISPPRPALCSRSGPRRPHWIRHRNG